LDTKDKTFHPPISSIDVDCGVQISRDVANWRVTITFWRPKSFEIQFVIPEKEALREWHGPLHRGRVYGAFAIEEMMRVPRISAAYLLRKAFELHIIDRLPYGKTELPDTSRIENRKN
jgi:hypothetical protein